MEAYAYRASLYCPDCAADIVSRLDRKSVAYSEDSDKYPQGPFSCGGGEADTPQHCDACGTFLGNPLTDDGRAYVREAIEDSSSESVARIVWAPFYGE